LGCSTDARPSECGADGLISTYILSQVTSTIYTQHKPACLAAQSVQNAAVATGTNVPAIPLACTCGAVKVKLVTPPFPSVHRPSPASTHPQHRVPTVYHIHQSSRSRQRRRDCMQRYRRSRQVFYRPTTSQQQTYLSSNSRTTPFAGASNVASHTVPRNIEQHPFPREGPSTCLPHTIHSPQEIPRPSPIRTQHQTIHLSRPGRSAPNKDANSVIRPCLHLRHARQV
jgi:hypothetical protein